MNNNAIAIMQAQIEALQEQLKQSELKIQALEKKDLESQKQIQALQQHNQALEEHNDLLKQSLTDVHVTVDLAKAKKFIQNYGLEDQQIEVMDEIKRLNIIEIHGPFDIFPNWKSGIRNAANRIFFYRPEFYEKYRFKVGLEDAILEIYVKLHSDINYGSLPYYFDADAYKELVAYLDTLPEEKESF